MIDEKISELVKIAEKYPRNIPVKVAAEFDGIDPDTLRTSLKLRQCPFGYFVNAGERAKFIIPTVTWYLFHTGGQVVVPMDKRGDKE